MAEAGFAEIVRPEPIVRADGVAHISFERRDTQAMRRFLEDFGLVWMTNDAGTDYFRGYGNAPSLVSVKQSERDTFSGFALAARSRADVVRLARATSRTIGTAKGLGGGDCLRLTDPDGLAVDFVYGGDAQTPLECRTPPLANTPNSIARINRTIRTPLAPSPIFRIGHIVLQRPDFERSAHWYMRYFGLLPSDIQALPDGNPALGFFRCDRGAIPADHHSLALLAGPEARMLHVSFETLDIEAIGQGHQYLRTQGYNHHWGIGRHVMGSQIFDYWKDPVGDEWEHYADGDLMTAEYPTNYSYLNRGSLWSWGDDLPPTMRPDVPLEKISEIHASGAFGSMELSRIRGLIEAMQTPPRPWLI